VRCSYSKAFLQLLALKYSPTVLLYSLAKSRAALLGRGSGRPPEPHRAMHRPHSAASNRMETSATTVAPLLPLGSSAVAECLGKRPKGQHGANFYLT